MCYIFYNYYILILGFYDHVIPPSQGIPNPDGLNASAPALNFTRLGIRVPTVMISPWINKGTLIHEPVNSTSHFEHSSILSTLKE
jgi:phospholipase C